MINKIKKYIKNLKLYNDSISNIHREGTLLNSFLTNKIIFIHVPKTAGVSIIRSLFGDVTLESHRNIQFYQKIFRKDFANYFTFSFVRNPWDRLYSSYMFLKKGGLNLHDKNAFLMHLSSFKTFEDFVLHGLDDKILEEIIHFVPQHKFLCDNQDNILVNYLGRFENLDEDVKNISSIINRSIILEHNNINKKLHYKDVYNSSMIKKVQEVYCRDIEIFEYDF